jgi:hypothetical protein
MRIMTIALATLLLTAGVAVAQTPPASTAPSTRQMQPGAFGTEADAKAHCTGNVVWMNNNSHVYHYAGTRDYGHTKNGAYLCQPDADKVGRAAKNEKAPGR